MEPRRTVDAPAIRIEIENDWAWCGEGRLDLAPRVFALLRHLVEHPKRLIRPRARGARGARPRPRVHRALREARYLAEVLRLRAACLVRESRRHAAEADL